MAEQIEGLIETSGLQWTFLRAGIFAANAQRWWAPQIRASDVFGGRISLYLRPRSMSVISPQLRSALYVGMDTP
jgi:hypothetical protein